MGARRYGISLETFKSIACFNIVYHINRIALY